MAFGYEKVLFGLGGPRLAIGSHLGCFLNWLLEMVMGFGFGFCIALLLDRHMGIPWERSWVMTCIGCKTLLLFFD